jgi:hypothetical protein
MSIGEFAVTATSRPDSDFGVVPLTALEDLL